MATYDRNLGVWRASDGTGGFGSQAEAEAYEDTGQRSGSNDTDAFSADAYNAIVGGPQAPTAPVNPTTQGQRDRFAAASQQYQTNGGALVNQQSLDPSVSARAVAANPAAVAVQRAQIESDKQGAHDAMVARTGGAWGDLGRLAAYTAGAAANPAGFALGGYLGKPAQAVINPLGTATAMGYEAAASLLPGGNGVGGGSSAPPAAAGTGGLPPSSSVGGIRTPERPAAGGAGGPGGAATDQLATDQAANQAGRAADKQSLTDAYEQARYDSSADSEESRALQRDASAKQSQIYDLLTKFDPDAYAQRASDLALKNQLAIARSATGSAGAQSDAMFQALEAAPGINAEAQRASLDEQNRRLGQAATVAGQMGELATGTRGQDIGESQLKSEFGLRIADGISELTGLDWQLDSSESQTLAEVALALDAQDIQWADLDLRSQIAEADRVMAEAGLTQQWRMFKSSQQLSEKDIYGGLMTLLGAGVSGGFQIAAANAGAKNVAARGY